MVSSESRKRLHSNYYAHDCTTYNQPAKPSLLSQIQHFIKSPRVKDAYFLLILTFCTPPLTSKSKSCFWNPKFGLAMVRELRIACSRDHPYITLAHFYTFSGQLTHPLTQHSGSQQRFDQRFYVLTLQREPILNS